jgi:hypothetical protein
MQRGGCYFSDKVLNAQAGGAAGVVLTDNRCEVRRRMSFTLGMGD